MSNSSTRMSVLVAQFPVSLSIASNLEMIVAVLEQAQRDELVVLPEGALSGYAEDPDFLQRLDVSELTRALEQLRNVTQRRGLHVVLGSCLNESGKWYNAGLYCGPQGEQGLYYKINLAIKERGFFTAGSRLPLIKLIVQGQLVTLGIQLCREIRFPEQWQYLARAGAEVFAYLTNAVGDNSGEQVEVWRSHLISRAAENQRFVLGVNNAGKGQKCPSMVVAPDGKVLWEALSSTVEMKHCEIDVAQISNWYLNQARLDVVA